MINKNYLNLLLEEKLGKVTNFSIIAFEIFKKPNWEDKIY